MTFSFSFSHMFLYLSLFCACYLEESLGNGKWCAGGFPVCAPPLSLFLLHVRDHHPPNPFYIISKERNYFCPIMIFSPCYDIICFNFNLNVMDVRGFLN